MGTWWSTNRKTRKKYPIVQKLGQNVEKKWASGDRMALASKTKPMKCEICKINQAIRKDEDGLRVCQHCFDQDSTIDATSTAPHESVLENSAPNESVLEGKDEEDVFPSGEEYNTAINDDESSLMDGTQTRGSARLQGDQALLGSMMKATPSKKRTQTETELEGTVDEDAEAWDEPKTEDKLEEF